MSSGPDNVKLQLRNIIGKFQFEELEQAVLPSFPELTWNKLRSSLIKHHQNFTTSASISVIMKSIEDSEIGDRELRDRLSDLQLIDVSRHSSRRIWTCYELRGARSDDEFQSDSEIQKRISESFKINAQRMDVRVTSHNSITFVLVKDLKRAKRSKRKIFPIYFAFLKGQKYFFASRKTIAKDSLLAMTRGLGYTENKLAKLSGTDLKSLIELLWIKQQRTISSGNIIKPVYNGLKPVIRRTGIDFTGYKDRGEFVDECFGIEPPITQSLHAAFVNQTWKCSELVPGIEDETIDIKWEFRSHNIAGMIKRLVQRRVMRLPMPLYAENILTMAKNEMMLRAQTP